eukprot:263122-Chlamydomonas_euryale.AAC.1
MLGARKQARCGRCGRMRAVWMSAVGARKQARCGRCGRVRAVWESCWGHASKRAAAGVDGCGQCG